MQKSVNFTVIFLTAFLFLICSAYGQNKEDKFTGKWLSKDKMIVEVYKVGKGFNIKQLEAPKQKEKLNNGKVGFFVTLGATFEALFFLYLSDYQ